MFSFSLVFHLFETDPPSSPLNPATDVVFIVDASQDVNKYVLTREKDFVKALAQHFNISTSGPRSTAVVYADRASTIASFGEQDFDGRVDSITLLKAPRRMDRALEYAAQVLTRSGRDGRKIVILLAAGRQSSSVEQIGRATKSLQSLGVQTFVVAIGQQPNIQELIHVVQRSEDIFRVTKSEDLPLQSRGIAEKIHKKRGMQFCLTYNISIL